MQRSAFFSNYAKDYHYNAIGFPLFAYANNSENVWGNRISWDSDDCSSCINACVFLKFVVNYLADTEKNNNFAPKTCKSKPNMLTLTI